LVKLYFIIIQYLRPKHNNLVIEKTEEIVDGERISLINDNIDNI